MQLIIVGDFNFSYALSVLIITFFCKTDSGLVDRSTNLLMDETICLLALILGKCLEDLGIWMI